ncbi:MAG TPA: hypothetical protein VKT77_22540, partial [Chthonomonadaceae bacterium]|nr:hypothetical protein [Chthonomonadaceae bacterium]
MRVQVVTLTAIFGILTAFAAIGDGRSVAQTAPAQTPTSTQKPPIVFGAYVMGAGPALPDQDNTRYVGWTILPAISEADLTAYLAAHPVRVVDLQAVDGGSAFDAVVIDNTGSYARSGVRWFHGLSIQDAESAARTANLRITSIAPYLDKENRVVAAGVMIPNQLGDKLDWQVAEGSVADLTKKLKGMR